MVMRQNIFKDKDFFDEDIQWNMECHSDLRSKLSKAFDDEHKGFIFLGLLDYSRVAIAESYTLGESLTKIGRRCELLFDDAKLYIDEFPDSDLFGSGTLESYINCLWLLSFCYFFKTPKERIQLIADHISLTEKDWLIDRLIAASIPGHPIAVGQLAFPEIYKPLAEALSYDQTTEERNKKIQMFLKNYYPLLKKYDVTWHDSHKEPDPEYCNHFGYWIFELAALSADIGWDDTSFRDHPMYSKDLVDWKFAQRPKDKQIKI